MTRRRLALSIIGEIREDPHLPAWLAGELSRVMGIEAVAGPELALDERWVDPETGRYDSNRIVDALIDALAPDAPGAQETHNDDFAWTLALTEADLSAPGRPFVFGEATLNGPCAVVSLARLHSPIRETLRLRALKEAAHEIGHLAGLDHCTHPRCVMFPSRDLSDTDAKDEHLCEVCRTRPHRLAPP